MSVKGTFRLLAWVVCGVALWGCKPSPEKLCKEYVEKRNKDWPEAPGVEKACVKELSAVKDKSAEGWGCVAGAIEKQTSIDEVATVLKSCRSQYKMEDDTPAFAGLGFEESGAWADSKPKKLDAAMCREGAWGIAVKKRSFGMLLVANQFQDHVKELEKACKENGDKEEYALMFACLRRVKTRADLLPCGDGSQARAKGGR